MKAKATLDRIYQEATDGIRPYSHGQVAYGIAYGLQTLRIGLPVEEALRGMGPEEIEALVVYMVGQGIRVSGPVPRWLNENLLDYLAG